MSIIGPYVGLGRRRTHPLCDLTDAHEEFVLNRRSLFASGMSDNGSMVDEESIWNLVRTSNDSHTCYNASIETENFHRTKIFMYMYLRFMIIYPVFNVILHSFSLMVFYRMRSKSVLVRLLVALSIAEVVFQASTASIHLFIYMMETGRLVASSLVRARNLAFVLPTFFVLVTSGNIARNWFVLLIAVMRFEFVCRHSWKRFLFRNHTVAPKVIAVWLMALTVSSLRFFEMQFWVCTTNNSVTFMTNNFLKFPWYIYGYTGGVLALVQNVGPVTAVCVLSGCLLHVLFRQRTIRRNLRSTSSGGGSGKSCTGPGPTENNSLASRSTDLLVVLLCVTYALCELPSFLKAVHRMDLELQELAVVMNVMICVDSTLGFFIYLVTNPDFRTTLLRTCCCRVVSQWMNMATRRLTWTERQSTFERSRQIDVPVVMIHSAQPDGHQQPLITNVTATPPTIEMEKVTESGRWSCAAMDVEDNEWPMLEAGEGVEGRLRCANSTTDSSV